MPETLSGAAAPANVVELPTYVTDTGEAAWEGDWGSVSVAPIDLDDAASARTVSVDVEPDLECGMEPEVARRLARVIVAACDAAAGEPLGWRQYFAESPPLGEPDPDHCGMVQVAPGHWEGPTRLSQGFELGPVFDFHRRMRAAAREVTVYTRTFRTLADVTAWEPMLLDLDETAEPAPMP